MQEESTDSKEREKSTNPTSAPKEGAESVGGAEVHELQAKVKALQEQKLVIQAQVEGYRQAGKETRDKGDILAAERKARAQVRTVTLIELNASFKLLKICTTSTLATHSTCLSPSFS